MYITTLLYMRKEREVYNHEKALDEKYSRDKSAKILKGAANIFLLKIPFAKIYQPANNLQ